MMLLSLSGHEGTFWNELEDGVLPENGADVAVPLARLQEEGDAIFAAAGNVAAIVPTEIAYSELEPFVGKVKLFDIRFPAFGDGRGFSIAVRLRKDMGYTGEIRASGHVIPDQAQFLLRAGFDTAVSTEERKAAFEKALTRFSAFYQTDFAGRLSVAHLRHGKDSQATNSETREAS